MKTKRFWLVAIAVVIFLIIVRTAFKKPIVEKSLTEHIASGELKKTRFTEVVANRYQELEIINIKNNYSIEDESYQFNIVNKSDFDYGYASYFQFYYDEIWYDVPMKENVVRLDLPMVLKAGTKELIEEGTISYVELCPGQYRIAVPIFDITPQQEDVETSTFLLFVLSCEFTIS